MSQRAGIVFVVDDDAAHLASVGRLLRAAGYTVASFTSASDFLAQCRPGAEGCVIADLQMPGVDGLALQRALLESGSPLPVVFLTGHGDIPSSVSAMRRGAEDFLVKTAPADELLVAVERAFARGARERREQVRQEDLRARFDRLTPREREVLAHVVRGRLNKQIAADLRIAERSVKRHRTSLMAKLEAASVADLARLAVEAGFS